MPDCPSLAIGHRGHGRHADFLEALYGSPFLAGAKHRRLGREQVLGNLSPADAAMNLDEVTAPGNLGTQRAATFQFPVDLALQTLDLFEGVLALPQAFEWLGQHQAHGAPMTTPAGDKRRSCAFPENHVGGLLRHQ